MNQKSNVKNEKKEWFELADDLQTVEGRKRFDAAFFAFNGDRKCGEE